MLNPKIVKDTAGVYWLQWTPDPSAEGYAFQTPAGASRTFDPTASKAKLGKPPEPIAASIAALDITSRPAEYAAYPTDTPTPVLGTAVGTAPPPLEGPTLKPTTTNELLAAIRPESAGKVIDLNGRTFDLAGGTLALCPLAARAEIRNGKIINGGTNSNIRAAGTSSNWTLRSIASETSAADGYKLTDDNSGIWLVDCTASRNAHNGYLTSERARDFQHWNCTAKNNGGTSTLYHGWYVGSAYGDSRILNPYSEANAGYGIQIQYASVQKLLVSMPELKGGNSLRGGFVLSTNAQNTRIIGPYVHDCAYAACATYGTVTGMIVEDGYQERNSQGWVPAPGVTYLRCKNAPRGPVDPAVYPWVTALDARGAARPIPPLAGCYA